MALMNGGGKVDRRFSAIDIMKEFGWDYPQYLHRPLWFDPFYEIKLQAEDKHREIKEAEQK